MLKQLKNIECKTYDTLFKSNNLPTMSYASGVWGLQEYQKNRALQNKVGHINLAMLFSHPFLLRVFFCREKDSLHVEVNVGGGSPTQQPHRELAS